jgi:hypothetical protein
VRREMFTNNSQLYQEKRQKEAFKIDKTVIEEIKRKKMEEKKKKNMSESKSIIKPTRMERRFFF